MRVIDLRTVVRKNSEPASLRTSGPLTAHEIRLALPRADATAETMTEQVAPLLQQVATGGAVAALALGEQFDGIRPAQIRVPEAVLEEALAQLDSQVRQALTEMIRRVRLVHQQQRPADRTTEVGPGARVSQRWVPVQRVGLYVPGGAAVYPSSVVMNVVPAQAADVAAIAVASPPQITNAGWPDPVILAACALLGVQEVYAVGGAQAIALLAYGDPAPADGSAPIEPVSLITGPGNIFVATAKRMLASQLGIDAEAGPTEIMVLADDSANPAYVAADLLSQAEHDPLAAAVLVTDSPELITMVQAEIARQLPEQVHAERITQALAGSQSALMLVDTLDDAVAVAQQYAAEHLSVQTTHPAEVAPRLTTAGALFLGPYSPVSLGDYCAGSNHVLPTGGTAAYSSGLNTSTFLRSMQQIEYDAPALTQVSQAVTTLAQTEGLPAHADAITIRVPEGEEIT